MAISDDVLSDLLTFIVTTLIMFFIGRYSAKNDTQKSIYNDRINTTIDSIRNLTDDSVKYFTVKIDDRERTALTAIITSNLRRMSTDISDIAKNTKNNDESYLKQWTSYYSHITSEPFGDYSFEIISNIDPLLDNIRRAEENLIIVLRKMIST